VDHRFVSWTRGPDIGTGYVAPSGRDERARESGGVGLAAGIGAVIADSFTSMSTVRDPVGRDAAIM